MPDSTAIRARWTVRSLGSGPDVATQRASRVSGVRLLQLAATAAAFGLILVITFA